MTEDLSDVRQRSTSPQHLRRGCVPQAMGTEGRNPDSFSGILDDRPHTARSQSTVWRPGSKEDLAKPGTRTTVFQIGRDGFTHIVGKRQPVLAPPLPTDNKLAGMPVDVFEGERGHLAGTEAQANHEEESSEVATADSSPAVARVEEFLHLPFRQVLGKPGQTPTGDRWH